MQEVRAAVIGTGVMGRKYAQMKPLCSGLQLLRGKVQFQKAKGGKGRVLVKISPPCVLSSASNFLMTTLSANGLIPVIYHYLRLVILVFLALFTSEC